MLATKTWTLILLVFAYLFTMSGCEMLFGTDDDGGGSQSQVVNDDDEDSEDSDDDTTDNDGQVLRVEFPAGELTREIQLTGVSGRSVYLVKANFSESAAESESTGVANFSAGGSAFDSSSVVRTDVVIDPQLSQYGITPEDSAKGGIRFISEDGRFILDRRDVRDFDPGLLPGTMSGNQNSSRSFSEFERNESYSVDTTTKEFWVDDGPNGTYGEFEQIPATLRAIGDNSYVWVHDANFDSASTSSTDNKINTAQAETMRDGFELIYPEITNLLGYEIGGGPEGDGGLDGDLRINILFYDIRNDYAPDQGGGVGGYFSSKDAYTQEQLEGGGYELKSNETEIFYIDAHFTDSWPDAMKSVLAHEYQHMIHFGQKAPQGLSSPTWFNEMLSMAAEDFVYETLGTTIYQSHPSGRVRGYNDGYLVSGIVDWRSDDYELYSYASAYIFGAFLSRNYGGAELVHQLSTNDSVGIESINSALAHLSYSESFEDIVEEYSRVHVFPTGHDALLHDFGGTSAAHAGETYNLPAFDLFHIENLDGADGPIALDVDQDTLNTVRPYGFQTWSTGAWQNLATDTFTIELERPTSSDVQLYLMIK